MLERTSSYRQRHREVTYDDTDVHWSMWLYDDASRASATQVAGGSFPWSGFDARDEKITEETSKAYFKNCYHRRTRIDLGVSSHLQDQDLGKDDALKARRRIEIGPTDTQPFGGYYQGVFTHGRFSQLQLVADLSKAEDFVVQHPTDAELASALKAMLPTAEHIAGGFSVLNFVYELRELKQTFLPWKRDESILSNMKNLHLNWEFGIKPFVGDLTKIFTRLMTLHDYIEMWNLDAKVGQVRTRHYTISSSDNTVVDKDKVWSGGGSERPRHGTTTVVTSERKIAHLMFKTHEIDWSVEKYLIWYKALGLHRPLDTIWNSIPFSFIVDWFVSVGDFLADVERDKDLLPHHIVDFGYSYKRVEKRVYEEAILSREPGLATFKTDCKYPPCRGETSVYYRRRIHPPLAVLEEAPAEGLVWRVPSLKQWLLGAEIFT